MPTPNRGYTYPTTSAPATVPADLRVPLEQVDADVQTVVDQLEGTVRLNEDGSLPEAVEERVEQIAVAFGSPAGAIPVFSTLAEAQAWELANPGRTALTLETQTPDVTPPVPGTLHATPAHTSATLSVEGASDDRPGLQYAFRVDAGAWSAWQADAEHVAGGLTELTGYTFQHKVTDAAGHEVLGAPVSATTTDTPPADWSAYDSTVTGMDPYLFLPLTADASNGGTASVTFTNNGGVFGAPIAGTTGVELTGAANITASLSSVPAIEGEGTFAAVVMPSASMAGVGRVLGSASANLQLYAMAPTFGVSSSGGAGDARSTTAAEVGVPFHLVATAAGDGTLTLYVNGAQAATATVSGVYSKGGDSFAVGSQTGATAPHIFQGTITRAAAWTRALTASEVQMLAELAGF